MAEGTNANLVELATELTVAWLQNPNNRATAEEVPIFLRNMHSAIGELANGTTKSAQKEQKPKAEKQHVPAVSVRASLASKDHIISMIDGKPYKTLRRHLGTHGLTPEEYRRRYGLKPDYPMVAVNYSNARRQLAKKIGLGAKGRTVRAQAAPAAAAPARKPRRQKTAPSP